MKATKMKECHVNILNAIKEYIKINGYSPTLRELAEMCKYKSISTVFNHLRTLENKGLIVVGREKRRAIRVIEQE